MLIPCERLQAILEGADVGIWQLHVPTDEMSENAVFARMLGISPDSAESRSIRARWAANMHPEDKKVVHAQRQRLMAGETDDYNVDYRVKRDGGGWNTLRARVRVVEREADGKPLWLAGVVSDVSGEKELKRLMHALFDRPFMFMGLLTPDGVLVEANRTTIEHTGVRPEDVIGKFFWEGAYFRHSTEQQARVREGIARAAQGEIVRFEVSYLGRDEMLSTLDFTLTPLYDDDGRIINIIHEARDISDLARTRDALSAAEERLRTATSGASIGLYDWTVGSNDRWYNVEWFAMLGYAPQELPATRQTIINLCHPDDLDRVMNGMADYINGGVDDYRFEFRMRAKSGDWRWIHSQASAVERDTNGRALRVAGVHMDITDRKAMEVQLASAQRLESIGQLAAGIAHEINTPVQYVNDSIYFVREGVQELLALVQKMQSENPDAPLNEELQYLQDNLPAALDRAVEGLGRVSEIVRSMKEFSHPDNKAMEPFDINRGIQSTLVVARNEYKFVADAEMRLGEVPAVICRGGEINQVILNLVVNSAHAIADRIKDSGERGRIVVESRCDGDDVLISVADTGGGIPESVRHRIFEPFFTTKEVGKGTGQGLAIASSVVRAHGGSLSFQTELGVGTTFLIRLPVKPVQQAERVEAA